MKHWLLSGDPDLIKKMIALDEEEKRQAEKDLGIEPMTEAEVAQAKAEFRELGEFSRQLQAERRSPDLAIESVRRTLDNGLIEEEIFSDFDEDENAILIEFRDGGLFGMEELPT